MVLVLVHAVLSCGYFCEYFTCVKYRNIDQQVSKICFKVLGQHAQKRLLFVLRDIGQRSRVAVYCR